MHNYIILSYAEWFVDVSNMPCRAGVVVSARIHPGESNSSWMMQGLIDWLTSDSLHAKVHCADAQPAGYQMYVH